MIRRDVLLGFSALAAGAALPLPARAAERGTLTVFAAASLREAFDALAPDFTAESGWAVRFDVAGSDALAQRIIAGAPADVFASANETEMRRIGDMAVRPEIFARNRLVVAVPAASTIRDLDDLARPGVKLVLGAPTVPVGAYARRALATAARERGRPADFLARVTANVVSEETDVKAVAAKVALGEADAGIVYATDVRPLGPRVRAFPFPPGVAPEAAYPIAALRDAPSPAGAAAFVRYVTAGAGTRALRDAGFLTR